jgi:hypothetical protein
MIEFRRPARWIVAEDTDAGIAEVHGSLDRLGWQERHLGCLQAPGVQGDAVGAEQPRVIKIEMAADPGSGQPYPLAMVTLRQNTSAATSVPVMSRAIPAGFPATRRSGLPPSRHSQYLDPSAGADLREPQCALDRRSVRVQCWLARAAVELRGAAARSRH